MPCRFKMQTVLDYREHLEEDAKVRLATAQRRHQKAQERLEQLQAELRRSQDHLCDGAMMDAAERWLLEQYVKGLRGDVAAAALQARMLAQMVEEARNLLAARAIAKKLLDKLKDRQKQYYARAEQLKEQRFNDEIATLRYKTPSF